MNSSIFGSSAPKFIFNHNAANKDFTVVASTNIFTCASHGLVNGQRIKVATTTTLPSPLAVGTYYYVRDITTSTFKLALTRGGSEINITDTGTGTHSLNTELTVNLDYWVPINENTDIRNVKQESELEADRIILPRGEYLEIEGRVNLYKYADMLARQSKFSEIYEFKNKTVSFWKHKDGGAYTDEDGNELLFYLESVVPKNLTTLDYRDVLYLKFISLKGISFANNWEIITPMEEIIIDDSFIVDI